MKGKVVLVLCVLALLISGVVAASVDNKSEDKKTDDGAVNDNNNDRKDEKNIETQETGDNKDDTAIEDGTETGSKRIAISSQAAVTVEALKGPAITDLIIHVPTDVTLVKKLQIKAYYADGTSKFSRNFFDLPAVNGISSLQLNDLLRGEKVDLRIQTDRYGWLEASTTVLNRPDLVISVSASGKVPDGDTLSVNATVQEKNMDTGANASVVLLNGDAVLDTKNVAVAAGGTTSVVLSAVLTRGEYNLTIKITNSVPSEYDESNNVYNLLISAVSPDLAVSGVSASANVAVGSTFNAEAVISEVSGDAAASATIALLEGTGILDSKSLSVTAGGSGTVNLSTVFRARGDHNLSVRIINSIPVEYNETNSVYEISVRSISPDLAVSNVSSPANTTAGETFEVLAEIKELYGEAGASATVSLLENNNLLDTKTLTVNAGTTGTVSLGAILSTAGIHTLTVRIADSVPQDADSSNNEQSFTITVVSSDLAVSNVTAPVYAAAGQVFEVLAEIKELSGNAGARAIVSLLENGTVLDNSTVDIGAGSTVTVSLNGTLATVGGHNLLVRIVDSVPQDADSSNNELGFTVFAKKAPETMSFASKYYYQNESSNTSHYITASGHVDNSEELVFEEKETISFTSSSSRALSFPIDRVYINITSEAGTGTVYEERNVTPANGTNTFTKYYPETNAALTLSIGSNGVTLNIERNASNSTGQSKGYLYWWFKGARVWDVMTNSSTGEFLGARESMQVQVEVEDGLTFMGGNTVTGISGTSYTGGWSDNTEGKFVQKKFAWVYSGSNAGITVIG